MSFGFAYGHLLSTVGDLHHFAVALEDPRVLPESFSEMFFNDYG